MLSFVDALCSEYGWGIGYVLHDLPFAQGFAMFVAAKARRKEELGAPGYEEQDMMDEFDGQRKRLRAMAQQIGKQAGLRRRAR